MVYMVHAMSSSDRGDRGEKGKTILPMKVYFGHFDETMMHYEEHNPMI